MDCVVHGGAKSWTRLSDFHFQFGYSFRMFTLTYLRLRPCISQECPCTFSLFALVFVPQVYGHTTLNAPDLIWSRKLSRVGPGLYSDGSIYLCLRQTWPYAKNTTRWLPFLKSLPGSGPWTSPSLIMWSLCSQFSYTKVFVTVWCVQLSSCMKPGLLRS